MNSNIEPTFLDVVESLRNTPTMRAIVKELNDVRESAITDLGLSDNPHAAMSLAGEVRAYQSIISMLTFVPEEEH